MSGISSHKDKIGFPNELQIVLQDTVTSKAAFFLQMTHVDMKHDSSLILWDPWDLFTFSALKKESSSYAETYYRSEPSW